TWNDFKPISLCNVTNKIFFKLLYNKLSQTLLDLISPSQSGFVPGRLNGDNFLIAQEIIHHLDLRYSKSNLVIKLDISKAYDRVNWNFLITVMQKMGFPPRFLTLIKSKIASLLSLLTEKRQTKCEVKISHLSYADDVIFFTNCEEASLTKLMKVLRNFKEISGPKINHAKSAFIPGKKANLIARRIKSITGFSMKALPITYLEAPFYKSNKKKMLYKN
ncbi:UNVERIFIED_CONTAM: hypothetical protein Slati_0829300, partial [Sesamum latifolium]